MRTFLLTLTLGAVAMAAIAGEAPLTGAWSAVRAERNGAPATDVVGHRLTFDGEAFDIVKPNGAEVYSGTFAADPSVEPHTIDFTNTGGEAAGTEWAGIWRLDGTTLTIVDNAPDPGRARPADFAAPAGSGYILVVFERAD